MKRILLTGSRDWTDKARIYDALDAERDSEEFILVHGACPTGADAIAAQWATENQNREERWPAQWNRYGKKAGPKRNQDMVNSEPDLCLAFTVPHSRGTSDCMGRAARAGIPVILHNA